MVQLRSGRMGPAAGVDAGEGGLGHARVWARNCCSTPRVTFLQEGACPRVSVKVLTWATTNTVVPVTTTIPEGRLGQVG